MKSYRYVILGGGTAAGAAAAEFVKGGLAAGELCIVSADNIVPYNRPPLSKKFLDGVRTTPDLLINPESFYRDHGIDVLLPLRVDALDSKRKRLVTETGTEIGYEKLLVATGAAATVLPVPGGDLRGVLYLRSRDDSRRIRAQATLAERVVVVGAGFIGMEVSAAMAKRQLPTTMVYRESRVWEVLFTPETSAFFEKYYQDKGVQLRPSSQLKGFHGVDAVRQVELGSGEMLPADLVVMGTGARPVIGFLEGSGLELGNGVLVNEYLETNLPDVWAAGDVANYKDLISGTQRRVEHWDTAVSHGEHVARNMLGQREPYIHVPYFFSDDFDLSWEYWGDRSEADSAIHRGDVDAGAFSVWWLKGGQLVAAFAMDRPEEEGKLAEKWIRERSEISPEILEDASRPLVDG